MTLIGSIFLLKLKVEPVNDTFTELRYKMSAFLHN